MRDDLHAFKYTYFVYNHKYIYMVKYYVILRTYNKLYINLDFKYYTCSYYSQCFNQEKITMRMQSVNKN